ncbi:MAG: hypothetical protein ACLR7Z_19900 [Bilophila wadsworthia]
MTAAIAAFRAKQHPNLIQIFEVGTASMMAAKGAIRPVYEIMEAAGTPVDTSSSGSVASYCSSTDGKLIAVPFNAPPRPLLQQGRREEGRRRPDHFPRRGPKWPNSPRRSRNRRVQVRPHLRLAVLGAA